MSTAWLHHWTVAATIGLAIQGVCADSPPPFCEVDKLSPYALYSQFEGRFGHSVAMDGDLLIGGAIHDNPAGVTGAGSALLFRRIDGVWTEEAELAAGDPMPNARFGGSVDIEGDIAIVGAPAALDLIVSPSTLPGAAYVFRRMDGHWIQEQKLLPATSSIADGFGCAVAIEGNTIIVGAHRSDAAASDGGAAWVFTYDGKQWVQLQELHAAVPQNGQYFGCAVSLWGDVAVIGAFSDNAVTPDSGAAYVFRRTKGVWGQESKLKSDDPMSHTYFGWSVANNRDFVMIGSPKDGVGSPDVGSVYVFKFEMGEWGLQQKLMPGGNEGFGQTVDMEGDLAVIGEYWGDRATVYRFDGTLWSGEQHVMPSDDAPLQDPVGGPVATNGEVIALGATWAFGDVFGGDDYGAVYVFESGGEDCDGNGLPDACELRAGAPNCNHNAVLDACEIASGSAGDCDQDSAPDECLAIHDYQFDNSAPKSGFGYLEGEGYILWMNQFNVIAGADTLTHIAIEWSPFTPRKSPCTLIVYDDPNNDGNPADAVALTSVQTRAMRIHALNEARHEPAIIRITPTHVGSPGDSFFIAAYMPADGIANTYPAWFDFSQPGFNHAWYQAGPADQPIDLFDLGKNRLAPQQPSLPGNFVLRGIAIDCNGNGVADHCDIADGISRDANANGLPDECENLDCQPDLSGDGSVEINDVFIILGAWGPCSPPCPADLNGDEMVGIDDLFAVLTTWGPCE